MGHPLLAIGFRTFAFSLYLMHLGGCVCVGVWVLQEHSWVGGILVYFSVPSSKFRI